MFKRKIDRIVDEYSDLFYLNGGNTSPTIGELPGKVVVIDNTNSNSFKNKDLVLTSWIYESVMKL